MREPSRLSVAFAAALLVAAGGLGAEPPLTNGDVVAMVNAGLGTATIVAKIKASATEFQLDTSSLAMLTQQGVPDHVIRAMIERQSPTRSGAETQAWPRDNARRVWGDMVRVVDRCRARGELMLFDDGVQFVPVTSSTACTDANQQFALLWDQVGTICFKYVVLDEATVGVLQIQSRGGASYNLRAPQAVMQSADKEFKFQQRRLNYRCN
ncbi:MAG TPA: hypothetical protein VMT19_09375 [Thermoanaerobaculaceae bacterium]|nr:hypothetical protein [Thermoanaerobaculaceae bacterium]